jgi:hypothetical protein
LVARGMRTCSQGKKVVSGRCGQGDRDEGVLRSHQIHRGRVGVASSGWMECDDVSRIDDHPPSGCATFVPMLMPSSALQARSRPRCHRRRPRSHHRCTGNETAPLDDGSLGRRGCRPACERVVHCVSSPCRPSGIERLASLETAERRAGPPVPSLTRSVSAAARRPGSKWLAEPVKRCKNRDKGLGDGRRDRRSRMKQC